MTTRLLLVLTFSLLTACSGFGGGRGIPAPVESRSANPAPQIQPVAPTAMPQTPRPAAPAPILREISPVAPAPITTSPAPAAPETPSSGLLTSVDEAIAAGDLERAAAVSERALRIAPRDPQLWYRLASIRARQGRNEEAEGFARRALSFATADTALTREISAFLGSLE